MGEVDIEVGPDAVSFQAQTFVPLRRTHPMTLFTHRSYASEIAAMASACDPMALVRRVHSFATRGSRGEPVQRSSPPMPHRPSDAGGPS